MFSARNANATGSPSPMTATRPPNRMRLASTQPIAHPTEVASRRRVRGAPIRRWKRNTNSSASSAKQIGSGASSHHSGNTRFLMVSEPSRALCTRHHAAVPDQHEARRKPDDVGQRLHQPGDARRHDHQHHVDAHMLAAPQQPRRGEQRDQVERVFGDLVRPGKPGARTCCAARCRRSPAPPWRAAARPRWRRTTRTAVHRMSDNLFTDDRLDLIAYSEPPSACPTRRAGPLMNPIRLLAALAVSAALFASARRAGAGGQHVED